MSHPLLPSVITTTLLVSGCFFERSTEQATLPNPSGLASAALMDRHTQFTARTEFFVEHPRLVVGRQARFAVHLTQLHDGAAITQGQLEGRLIPSHGAPVAINAVQPAKPGVFSIILTPNRAGAHRLQLRLKTSDGGDALVLGGVQVFEDDKSAQQFVGPEVATDSGIAFSKEQQWAFGCVTRVVETAVLDAGLDLQGTVKPAGGREVIVPAPAEGRLVPGKGILPVFGDRVRAGSLLAVLTPTEGTVTDRVSLREGLRAARVTLAQAQRERDRAKRLITNQAAPRKRLEEAEMALAIAEAHHEAAIHHLRIKEAALNGDVHVTEESYHLRAPLSGTVVETNTVPGALVAPGATLYRLIDLGNVWIEARVPEAFLNAVASAQNAEIAVAGAPTIRVQQGHGKLVTVGSVLDPVTRTAPIVYAVRNPDGTFRIGMSATIRALTGKTPPGPVIPDSALVDENGAPTVYVQKTGEHFERRRLQLGVRQNKRVQVLSGLKTGERVVTKGAYELRLSTLTNALPAHEH